MNGHHVIACFVIYSNEQIVFQGDFEVKESHGLTSFPSTDGCQFHFSHSYQGTVCKIGISRSNNGNVSDTLQLSIPINRTKLKWKRAMIGQHYEVSYRCALEIWGGEILTKQERKHRRDVATGRIRTVSGLVFTDRDSNSDNSDEGT